jgi:D-beta-D-heptose 7-phosphate kinase/D-beta-D-heptose 1-phosphate adenosyltransferase
MATIFVNGCFDLMHEGHENFLRRAKWLGVTCRKIGEPCLNRLVVALNSDASARALKSAKWGSKYPLLNLAERVEAVRAWADEVVIFRTEDELHHLIEICLPCILVKGPDYIGKRVTGDDIAPVVILDNPETEEIREVKRKAYLL